MVSTSITMSSHDEGDLTGAAREHHCSICGDRFKIKNNLLVHQSVRHCQGNPQCLLCGKSFKRKASFKAHVISHLVEETLTCGECGEEMMDQKQLVRHTRQHRREMKEKLWRCKYCPRDFIDFKYYKEHLTAHSKLSASMSHRHHKAVDRSRFRHKCDVCTKSFQKPSQLGRHKLIHSGEKPYTCGECGKSFNQKGTLHTHVKQHSGEKQHACQFCSATFSQRGNLRSHVQRVHTVSTEDRGEVYYCQYCSCVFRKIGSLNAHLSKKHLTLEYAKIPLSSESDKATACTVGASEQSFTMKKLVTEVIEGEKWHLCPCCPKKFKKPSDLVKHIRIHTNEKPYRCPHCIRSFTVKSTLTAHMRTHSGFKEFNCEQCFKPFASRSTLKVHMKKQHIAEAGTNQ